MIRSPTRPDFPSKAVSLLMAALLVMSFKRPGGESLIPYYEWVTLGLQLLFAGIVVAMTPKFRLGSGSIAFLIGLSLLLIWAVATGFWSEGNMVSVLIRISIIFVPVFLLAFAASSGDKVLMFNGFSKVMVFGVAGVALASLILYFWGSESSSGGYTVQYLSLGPLSFSQCVMGGAPLYRVCSLFGNPNTLGVYVAIVTPLLIYCYRVRLISPLICLFILVVLFGSFAVTLSRAPFGGFMIALGAMYVLGGRGGTKMLLRALSILGAGLVFGVLMGQTLISSGAARLDAGLSSRGEAWSALLAGFIDNPLMGVGFGVSAETLLHGNTEVGSSHSLYFMLLAELGLVGFVVYLALWMLVVIRSLQFALRGNAAAAAVFSINIGLGLVQVFETSILRFSFLHYVWFFLAFWLLSSDSEEVKNVQV